MKKPNMPKITDEIIFLRKQVSKYRKLFIVALVLWAFFYLSGFFTSWWIVKGKLGTFPVISSSTKLLVLAPHPDDETLMTGGLIQRVLEKGGKVKVIFLTSGDGSKTTVAFDSKKVDLDPVDFITLGETRIKEALNAAKLLGLNNTDIYFLGFPDQGLTKVLQKNYTKADGNFVSPTTKVDHVPYPEGYHQSEAYLGENLVNDVQGIIGDFNPNVIVVGHPRDNHPDHRASYLIIEKLRSSLGKDTLILSSLVHYMGYPNPGGYLFPPRKLFGGDWVSLELSSQEIANDKNAAEAHKSQFVKPEDKILFERLTAKNELFEIE